MTVATERVFRSDETPKLKLVTRNIESVTVRAYKVDLETYFRKMHLARGVEGLDIALIDPDKTFEFKVPKYAKYQQLESTIELPLPGGARAGVMAVTVGSKTLEATTLVIQIGPRRDRQEFAQRGLRVRREHAHRQALARRETAHVQRPRGLRRGGNRTRRRAAKVLQGTQGRRRCSRLRRRRRTGGLQRRRSARRRRRPRTVRPRLHLQRPAGLSRRRTGQPPRLPPPRGRRRLPRRKGQKIHGGGLRQPQPPGPPGTGRRWTTSAPST